MVPEQSSGRLQGIIKLQASRRCCMSEFWELRRVVIAPFDGDGVFGMFSFDC